MGRRKTFKKRPKRVRIIGIDAEMSSSVEDAVYCAQFIGQEFNVAGMMDESTVYLPIPRLNGSSNYTIWDIGEIEVLEWEGELNET